MDCDTLTSCTSDYRKTSLIRLPEAERPGPHGRLSIDPRHCRVGHPVPLLRNLPPDQLRSSPPKWYSYRAVVRHTIHHTSFQESFLIDWAVERSTALIRGQAPKTRRKQLAAGLDDGSDDLPQGIVQLLLHDLESLERKLDALR